MAIDSRDDSTIDLETAIPADGRGGMNPEPQEQTPTPEPEKGEKKWLTAAERHPVVTIAGAVLAGLTAGGILGPKTAGIIGELLGPVLALFGL